MKHAFTARASVLERFDAQKIACWSDPESPLTLVSDAKIPLAELRRIMRYDEAAQTRLEIILRCVHWSDSFLGQNGTHIHGRCWMLHRPQVFMELDLWESLEYACRADWREVRDFPGKDAQTAFWE